MTSLKRYMRVGPSTVHGTGLFSEIDLPRGTMIGICKIKQTREANIYTLSTEAGPVDVKCRLRYINHSKRPNVAYFDDLTVQTIRKIRAGDELTHDYGDEWT